MKKLILALMLSLSSTTCLAMPNPMVEQPSILQAEQTVNLTALTVNPGTGYRLEKVYVIGGSVIELRYTNDKNQPMTIRTGEYKGSNTDISGIYTNKWFGRHIIGDKYILVVNLPNRTSSACWHTSTTSYSVTVDNIDPDEFNVLSTAIYLSALDKED